MNTLAYIHVFMNYYVFIHGSAQNVKYEMLVMEKHVRLSVCVCMFKYINKLNMFAHVCMKV